MSDSEDYEYEYDESDQEAMDAGSGGGGSDEDASFVYTDDDEDNANNDEGEVALENAYYNAKGERDSGELDEARETFESVVRMEVEQNKKEAGVDIAEEEDAMDVEVTTASSSKTLLLAPLKFHGPWSYKAVKQLVKLHLRSLNCDSAVKDYERLLRIASSADAKISPNAVEKGVNNMLDRVASLINNSSSGNSSSNSETTSQQQEALAQSIYDLTLKAFHPTSGIAPNERLWFKTNLKYGQLLYEMNETAKLQLVIRDLLVSSGQPTDILEGTTNNSSFSSESNTTSTGGTHVMEIAALQIQLYSRLKDTKKLRAAYHRAMSVRGGIPHPRTLALIQELGGKMHMSQRSFDEASQAFFQAFKSYDEAGDRSRLRCLKYLVMASMLHASSINPFDSHEARAHRDDPEIVAMTNLVQAFHNDDIQSFEKILKKNEGRIMDDEFVREHVADLLRTIRTQVIMRTIGPYTKIRLVKISKSLNGIPVEDVESLLVSLILDGKLNGRIDQVGGVLVKQAQGAADTGPSSSDTNAGKQVEVGSVEARNTASIQRLIGALAHLTDTVSNAGPRTSFHHHQQFM
eukprot:CAMPEP_0201713852 /NCGR_PEP_ID=MMETSP0593-20130828/545_1 /ASSEMBLY_ACC=CAM_ASM_000672 /TAXON_ID=267983 /ORGANISM="Skeletonema japonicum, Strain CCMP2506" /LENGTH=575 /DNA_ID=CAMNT_0048203051 /DNA_START=89 /DNA_END=1816 /DNA_ORIENTATION=-